MVKTYELNGDTWIDIDRGTPEEIKKLMDTYGIHPFVAKDLTSFTPRPRVEFHDGYVYCVLHFPVWKHTHNQGKSQEVDFIIGKNALITSRYDTIDALHKFGKTMEVEEILEGEKNEHKQSKRVLFANLLRELYNSVSEELEAIEDATDEITAKIFRGQEKEMVRSISETMRTLLDFKRTIDMHQEILGSLLRHGKTLFGEDFAKNIESVTGDYLKIDTTIKSQLDILRELRETNNSLLTSEQNETVRQLTVISFIILPLNLIAFIFAMRTEGMPLITNPNAFWIVLGIMITSAVIALTWAKSRKWV